MSNEHPPLYRKLEGAQLHGSAEYDALREELIWNARMHRARAPDCIVRPSSARKVCAIIQFARECKATVSLRGSSHNYQGAALRNGGIMVDLSGLDRVEIDVGARRARIGAGVTGGELIKQLSRVGLAFPIGHCSDVAASGYILSGGFGWNYGEWGPACVNVSEIEMVLASGEIVTANENINTDLFWAARGAGCSFFAAITAYELILRPLPPATFAINAIFEASSAPVLAQWINSAGAAAHNTVELICLVGPDHESGTPSITVRGIASGVSAASARAKLGALLDPPPEAKLIAPVARKDVPFADLTQFSAMPNGKRVAADQLWSDAPLGDLLLAVAHLAEGPQKSSAISLTGLGGLALTPRMPEVDCALSVGGNRSAGIYALWDDASEDQRHLDWVTAAKRALAPYSAGAYVGEADVSFGTGRITECFSEEAWERLKVLRQCYDPQRLFRSCGEARD